MAALRVLGVGLALAGVMSLHAEATLLPELTKHRDFAIRAANSGNADALKAAIEVLALKRVTYRLPEDITPAGKQAFVEATQVWERILNRDVSFTEVSGSQRADVEVTFEKTLDGNGQHYGGYTRWKRSITQDSLGHYVASVDAKMQLRSVQPNGKAMTVDQMRHAVMHEFGHILGLDDSTKLGDVMGPLDLRNPVDQPQPEEVAQLKQLRAEVRALRVQ